MQVIITIFHCAPAFWNVKGTCLPHTVLFWPSGIGNFITSLLVFIIPLPKIRSLERDPRTTIAVVLVFAFGSLDIVISAIRLLRMGSSVSNLTSRGGIWMPLESTVAIICVSTVALQPFCAGTIPQFLCALWYGRGRSGPNDDDMGKDPALEHSYRDEKELPRLPTPDEEQEMGVRLPCRIPVEEDELMGGRVEMRTSLFRIGREDGFSTESRENVDKEMGTRPRSSTLMRIGVVLPKRGQVTDSTILTTTPAVRKELGKRPRASTLMKVGVSLPNGGKVTDSTILASTPINTSKPERRERAWTLMRIGVVLPRGGRVTDSTILTTPSATEKEMSNRASSSTLVKVGMVLDDVDVVQ
ncbi:hypothetical protein E2P81_ATG02872 [Venturia nashicola]|nr:hypothetical protein E2P81_ATG02872 [Venturia nashicola]